MASEVAFKMRILYNDDAGIIDFMADLQDRQPIKALEKDLVDNKKKTVMYLCWHKDEKIYTLLLVNDPFQFNEGNNILMLFVHNKISLLYNYFNNWLENEDYQNMIKRTALMQILAYINKFNDLHTQHENTQTNQMG